MLQIENNLILIKIGMKFGVHLYERISFCLPKATVFLEEKNYKNQNPMNDSKRRLDAYSVTFFN